MITTLDIAMLTFMKKLSKEQIEKRNRIKQYLLRSLHIVSYVLSALFIILCIVVGVQSCNGKNKQQNVSKNKFNDIQYAIDESQFNQFNYSYQLNYKGDSFVLPLDIQNQLVKYVNPNYDVYNNISGPAGPLEQYRFSVTDLYVYNYETDEFLSLDYLSVVIQKQYEYSGSTSDVRWRVFSVEGGHYDVAAWYIIKNNYDTFGNNSFKAYDDTAGYLTRFYSSVEMNNNPVLSLLFSVDYSFLNFDFNNRINYNGYFNASLSSPYIPFTNLSTDIDLPYFVSGGNIYNRIHLQFTDANGSAFLDNSNQVFTLVSGSNIHMTYLYMEYVNTLTGLTTLVNTRDFAVQSNGNNVTRYNLNSSSWVSNNYSHVTFLFGIDNNSLNTITKFNSNTSNINVGYTTTDIGLGNVFTLLSTAFSGLVNLFAIQLIPGITIGILLFMPLIVGIIIVIVKLVKK